MTPPMEQQFRVGGWTSGAAPEKRFRASRQHALAVRAATEPHRTLMAVGRSSA